MIEVADAPDDDADGEGHGGGVERVERLDVTAADHGIEADDPPDDPADQADPSR